MPHRLSKVPACRLGALIGAQVLAAEIDAGQVQAIEIAPRMARRGGTAQVRAGQISAP